MMNTTLNQLRSLRLNTMAQALELKLQSRGVTAMSFVERPALLVDREVHGRQDRRCARLLKLAKLNLMLRQNWMDLMAESEKVWLRMRWPLGAPSHCMSRSSHTARVPRALSAALSCAQFVLRHLLRFFLASRLRGAYRLGWVDLCSRASSTQ